MGAKNGKRNRNNKKRLQIITKLSSCPQGTRWKPVERKLRELFSGVMFLYGVFGFRIEIDKAVFLEGLLFLGFLKAIFLLFCWYFFPKKHNFPYPQIYFEGHFLVTKRNSCGGPRCPNKTRVTKFPSLQHRHFLSNVLGLNSVIFMLKSNCKFWSFPRFQELLSIP